MEEDKDKQTVVDRTDFWIIVAIIVGLMIFGGVFAVMKSPQNSPQSTDASQQ